jgi:hypothetical protein
MVLLSSFQLFSNLARPSRSSCPVTSSKSTPAIGQRLGRPGYQPADTGDPIAHWMKYDSWRPPSRPHTTFPQTRLIWIQPGPCGHHQQADLPAARAQSPTTMVSFLAAFAWTGHWHRRKSLRKPHSRPLMG